MEWISVDERMPAIYQNVTMLRFDGENYFPDIGWWSGTAWNNFNFQRINDVKYWIKMPDPPEEG